MTAEQTSWVDKVLDPWWWPRHRKSDDARVNAAVDMIQVHLDFLDHLSKQSNGGEPDSAIGPARDFRLEFVTFYLQCRPDKRRMEARHQYKQGELTT